MSFMKKGIVLVQGINSKDYMLDEIVNSGLAVDNIYDEVTFVETEKIFDEDFAPKSWPIIGKYLDKMGDVWQFYLQKDRRKRVCREVRKAIFEMREKCGQVDVLAHSLGTVITLTCGKKGQEVYVDNFYCVGSPLSLGSWPLSAFVRNHTKKYGGEFNVKNRLRYYWSHFDHICSYYKNSVAKVLKNALPQSKKDKYTIVIRNHECESDHSLKEYMPEILYTYP